MAHAKVYVNLFEDNITYDEYEITLKESTLRESFILPNLTPQPPMYVLEYDGKTWSMPTRYVRFRDYDQLGQEAIWAALEEQIETMVLIYRNKNSYH